ncbi:MAG TPA: DUF885 domain-containing protein [Planctomycetota bacterium]|nr:DUF885 domain-containing protein [Planctomycetota bacterium]
MTPAHVSVAAFRNLSEKYVEETFERFPTRGSAEGRKEFNAELDKPDLKTHAAHEKLLRKTIAAVENLPEHDFGGDDWLDRRAFLAQLRTELGALDLNIHRRNPDAWASGAMDAVYRLVIRNADDLTPVAEAILSRMKKITDYLERAESMLKTPVPLWQKLTARTCAGAPSLFDALAEPLKKTGKAAPEKIDSLIATAKSAFAAYAKNVAKLKAGPPGSFAIGKERFEALIRERLGWDLTAAEAEAAGHALAKRIQAEMNDEAKRFDSKKNAKEILEDAAAQWQPAGALIDVYEAQTRHVADACKAADIVSFPRGERLLVKPVPDFMKHHFPTAAYSSPGAYDSDQTGIFWVNDLSLGKSTEKEKQAEIRQHFGLELTCAHEAYPGHHLQFCTANRHPSKLRRLFQHAIFYEGWTLWCEKMMVDQKIVATPTARLGQLHDALWRANRILVDVGLQTGKMSYEDAVKHMMRSVSFTRARAEGDVNWYTSSPTVPMSYLLGRTELLRVKHKKVDQGGWTLKQFNDWILSFGTLPWRWMELSGL